jgi:CubicO group peptidase (beta-lactamase class C family)
MIALPDLAARLRERAAAHGVVGAVVAVQQGDTVIDAATGVVNRRTGVDVTTDTVFQIGSVTKVYTATLVLQLVDDGLVDLDAPADRYLPGFRADVTVRQLLTHTSGIDGDFFDDFGRGDDCVERYVASVASLPQTSPPGAFFSYCNSGYVALARLVEVLRGQHWDVALRKQLLEPLGLQDTLTLPEEAIMRRAAIGHLPPSPDADPEVAPLWHLPRSVGPAGAIVATARDVLTFACMHMHDGVGADGRAVLSPASAKAMRELQVELADPNTLGDGWGLGWIVYQRGTPPLVGHDGATLGQQAYLRIVPEKDLALVLVTNGGGAGALFDDLARPLLRDVAGIELRHHATPPSPPVELDVTPFLGRYERTGVRLDIYRDEEGLWVKATGTGALADELPDDPPERLVVLNDDTLITAEPEERLGQHMTLKFLDRRPDGFGYVHSGARATPRARP